MSEPRTTPDQRPVSIDEASEAYPGQWLLMKVTAVDEYDTPTHGLIVASGPTRASIQQTILDVLTRPGGSDGRYCIFSGYKRIKSREEWSALIAKLIAEGTSVGRKRKQHRRANVEPSDWADHRAGEGGAGVQS